MHLSSFAEKFKSMNSFNPTFRTVWLWSLGFFILAAFTGFLFRLGMNIPLPFDLSFTNVRHAHSHLMFFNWVTPIPMVFIARKIVLKAPLSAGNFRNCIYTTMAVGFASYPFFLLNGYRPVSLGSASLPFSVIFSGLVMVCWYWFMMIYIKNRSSARQDLSLALYDSALIMLGISSLGAWGVAAFQFSGVDNPMFSSALTHFFLTTFTEGWCILAALGIMADISGIREVSVSHTWLTAPVLLGVPLMFPFGMSAGVLTETLWISARAGAFIVAASLSVSFYFLFKKMNHPLWLIALIFLGLKIIMQLGSSILPSSIWMGEHSLRVLYLHLILLGFVSLVFFTAYHQVNNSLTRVGLYSIFSAVILIILSLVMLTGYWPEILMPQNLLVAVTVIAVLPVFAAIAEWIIIWKYKTGMVNKDD